MHTSQHCAAACRRHRPPGPDPHPPWTPSHSAGQRPAGRPWRLPLLARSHPALRVGGQEQRVTGGGGWRRRRAMAAAHGVTPGQPAAAPCMHRWDAAIRGAAGREVAAMRHERLAAARIPACNAGPLLQACCRRAPPIGIAAGGAMHAALHSHSPCWRRAAPGAADRPPLPPCTTDPPPVYPPAAAQLARGPYVGDWRGCGDCSAAQRSGEVLAGRAVDQGALGGRLARDGCRCREGSLEPAPARLPAPPRRPVTPSTSAWRTRA